MSEIPTTKISGVFPNPDFRLQIMRIHQHGTTGMHRHEFDELVIILGGNGKHQIGTEVYEMAAGDVFVILKNTPHS